MVDILSYFRRQAAPVKPKAGRPPRGDGSRIDGRDHQLRSISISRACRRRRRKPAARRRRLHRRQSSRRRRRNPCRRPRRRRPNLCRRQRRLQCRRNWCRLQRSRDRSASRPGQRTTSERPAAPPTRRQWFGAERPKGISCRSWRGKELRRPQGGQRRQPLRAQRRGGRSARAKRCRQDHRLLHDHRPDQGRSRTHRSRRLTT